MPNRIDASNIGGLGFRDAPGPNDSYYSGHDASQEFPNVGNDIGSPPQNPVQGIPASPESENTFGGGQFQSQDDYAASVRHSDPFGIGLTRGRATPGQALVGLSSVFGPPGLASAVEYGVDAAGGLDGGIPAHEQFGAAGTTGITGGVFDAQGRAYDPVTGLALNEYRDRDAFYDGNYVQGIFDNPLSVDSYLGDPDLAPTYTAVNQAREQGARGSHDYLAATRGDRGIFGGQDDTGGGGPTPEEAARLAQYVGQTEHGFEAHTVAPGTATNEAIQGVGYTGSGAAPAGSQYSSTGTFSSSHSDDNNDDSFNDHGVSHSGGSGGVSFADDAASSNDGGGGGK